VSKHEKTLLKVLRGSSDANLAFDELCQLLRDFGFDERVRGSHHIFTKEGVEEILNLQPRAGKAKPYQVKQVRRLVLEYKLGGEDDEQ
jgi:hypothetical protein